MDHYAKLYKAHYLLCLLKGFMIDMSPNALIS